MSRLVQIFILSVMMTSHDAGAQQLSPFVISSSGGYSASASGTVSYTVGELALVQTFISSGGILTQGFQQPWILPPDHVEEVLAGFHFSFYPNPSDGDGFLRIEYPSGLEINIRLRDMLGRELLAENIRHSGGQHVFPLDITPYTSGTYVMSLTVRRTLDHETYRFYQKIIMTK